MSDVDDSYEREANTTAERVTQMASQVPNSMPDSIRTGPTPSMHTGAIPDVRSAIRDAARGGAPLSTELRAYFEPRFGRNFSDVRIHTDAGAADGTRAVQARAYTVGRDVVFGAGEYAPETVEGRRLIAHELSHVVQQTSAATPTVQRQPVRDDDVAQLERELAGKMEERAMLARMLEESSNNAAADVYRRRIDTGNEKEQARLKSGAGVDLARFDLKHLLPKVDVGREKGGFRLAARFELSYEGLSEDKGRSRAATDTPRIEKAMSDAWTVDLTQGRYAGNRFRLEPRIEFRPNAHKSSDKAFQLIVRGVSKGDTVANYATGDISFNPAHLEREQVVLAAHELYHLFGFVVDMYYIPPKSPKAGTSGPGTTYGVGRPDPVRGDLLGMPNPKTLREWRDQGLISQAEFDRQTRAQLKVWQEDANLILYALGAPVSSDKPSVQTDPGSPDFDPQAALREREGQYQRRLAELDAAIDRDYEIADSIRKAERAIQLDAEIAALQKKIFERKKQPAVP